MFVVAIIAYIQMKRSQTGHGVQSQKPLPSVAVLAIAFLLMYLLGSIFVFIWGVTLPIAGKLFGSFSQNSKRRQTCLIVYFLTDLQLKKSEIFMFFIILGSRYYFLS